MNQNQTATICSCPKTRSTLTANIQGASTCQASSYVNENCNSDVINAKLDELKSGTVKFTPNYCSNIASTQGAIGFGLGIADFVSGGLASTIYNSSECNPKNPDSQGNKCYTCYTQALQLLQCQQKEQFENCQQALENCMANIQKQELQDQFSQVQENLEYANDLLNYKVNYVYSLTFFGILFTFLLFVYILSE